MRECEQLKKSIESQYELNIKKLDIRQNYCIYCASPTDARALEEKLIKDGISIAPRNQSSTVEILDKEKFEEFFFKFSENISNPFRFI